MLIRETKTWKFFSSIKLAIWLIAIIALLSLIGTLIPQNQDQASYAAKYGYYGYRILLDTGLTDIYSSWYFILSLILFSLNLAACLLNRLSLRGRSLGSFISHLSILVILSGALIGMLYGESGYVTIGKGEESDSFIARDKQVKLGFSIRLDDFIYTENIDPKEKLLVYASRKDSSDALVAQIPVEPGRESEIAGTGYKVRILRYIPDFMMDIPTKEIISRSARPNNPAIEVELKDKAGNVKVSWVFARYPDMHKEIDSDFKFAYKWEMRQPKDFISKVTIVKEAKEVMSRDIRVNEPLRFGGYTFFQSSYDNEALSWSGLKIAKSPGVPVIYSGFILLIFGLVMIFYVNPLMQRR